VRSDTKRFLELIERQNQAIFDREEAKKKAAHHVEPDLVRLQREKERREKYGTLRAREQPSKRPVRARRLFGFTDMSSND
jgi:hypothetical protein